jgi:hypothetical protein
VKLFKELAFSKLKIDRKLSGSESIAHFWGGLFLLYLSVALFITCVKSFYTSPLMKPAGVAITTLFCIALLYGVYKACRLTHEGFTGNQYVRTISIKDNTKITSLELLIGLLEKIGLLLRWLIGVFFIYMSIIELSKPEANYIFVVFCIFLSLISFPALFNWIAEKTKAGLYYLLLVTITIGVIYIVAYGVSILPVSAAIILAALIIASALKQKR